MAYDLIIREEANEDIAHAFLYYEEMQEGLGERFLEGLAARYQDIAENPHYFGFIDEKKIIRDIKVRHFPYQIIFEIIHKTVVIYSVFNSYQDPSKKYK